MNVLDWGLGLGGKAITMAQEFPRTWGICFCTINFLRIPKNYAI